jgi:peptidoglycan/xylan/chitin deacetylase (PgdA/CDA1 family)
MRGTDGFEPLGVSRTIVLAPSSHVTSDTIPLGDGECVLTFDDGPSIPGTEEVLDALWLEQVKATFFVVGYRAKKVPHLVRRAFNEGHVIGTHTDIHRMLPDLPISEQIREVEQGFASTASVLPTGAMAPYFRFPFLRDTPELRRYLLKCGIMIWDADFAASDCRGVSIGDVVDRAMAGLQRQGRGVLLLHDVQPVTALALPILLREMKRRDFRIAHVVPGPITTPLKRSSV